MLRALVSGLPAFALSGHAADVLVSLAGLHHLPDRAARYLEAKRVLRPGGRIVVADVLKGSSADSFLNGFINEANSMGHHGIFLDEGDVRAMEDSGLGFCGWNGRPTTGVSTQGTRWPTSANYTLASTVPTTLQSQAPSMTMSALSKLRTACL